MKDFKLINVSQRFNDDGQTDVAIRDIDLGVKAGEFLAIMGPSGSGKSTLLRIMAGLIEPSHGQIQNRPKRISMVFQNFGLMPWLNVEDNIGYGLKMSDTPKNEIRSVVRQLIHELGLNGLERSHPKELSGGQKQRVGFARALAVDPEILMLDEAFSALDSFTADELRADVLKIWQATGKTIVMITHLPAEAIEMSDRVIVLSAGPGSVIDDIDINLPRPRAIRSKEFFALEDKLEKLIRKG